VIYEVEVEWNSSGKIVLELSRTETEVRHIEETFQDFGDTVSLGSLRLKSIEVVRKAVQIVHDYQ